MRDEMEGEGGGQEGAKRGNRGKWREEAETMPGGHEGLRKPCVDEGSGVHGSKKAREG